MRINLARTQSRIGAALALQRESAGLRQAHSDAGTGFAAGLRGQLSRWQHGHLDQQVETVQKWAAQPALVARHLLGCKTAFAQGVA